MCIALKEAARAYSKTSWSAGAMGKSKSKRSFGEGRIADPSNQAAGRRGVCNLAGREFGRRQRDDVYRDGCATHSRFDDDLRLSFPSPFYRVQQQHKASQIARLSVSARQNSPYQLAPSNPRRPSRPSQQLSASSSLPGFGQQSKQATNTQHTSV